MSNVFEPDKNWFKLKGRLAQKGYDLWRHSFTGKNKDTGEIKHFFVEYFTCNPLYGQKIPVLGQHTYNKKYGYLPSYLMVKAGWWGQDAHQIHKFISWNDTEFCNEKNFCIFAEDCFYSVDKIYGHVCMTQNDCTINPHYMSESGEMKWNLRLNLLNSSPDTTLTNKFLNKINSHNTLWYISGIKAEYEGYVYCNGETYEVNYNDCNGYCDKNWGCDFPNPWIEVNSGKLKSTLTDTELNNSAFSLMGSPPCLCGYPTHNKVYLHLLYENDTYNFDKLFLSKCDITETEDEIFWNIKHQNHNNIVQVHLNCNKSEMLKLNYESPNGEKLHNNLWSGGTGTGILKLWKRSPRENKLIDKIIISDARCKYGLSDKLKL